MNDTTSVTEEKIKSHKIHIVLLALLSVSIIFSFFLRFQFTAPESFTQATAFEVTQGMTVREIADEAKKKGLVRSELLLYSILTYSYDPTDIYAGTYIFNEPTSVFGVAKKLADKDIEKNLVRITLPEGLRLTRIADIASSTLPDFDTVEYLSKTADLEGYMFPETYFVPETFTATDLVLLQRNTYEENVSPLRPDIEVSNFTEYEVLILASIIEREANDEESMKMVAGVLQNRLAINMALQADASIEYIFDTPLNELPPGQLATELRETQSPYNTYLNRGLPPTPIGNPGIMAILAVLHPTPSENFFYLTAPDGQFYYSETFAKHTQYIAKYLR
jgi:UPF0755 protein